MMTTHPVRILLVLVAVLLGLVVGQVAGILAVASGTALIGGFAAGGIAFGATVTLSLSVTRALGLF